MSVCLWNGGEGGQKGAGCAAFQCWAVGGVSCDAMGWGQDLCCCAVLALLGSMFCQGNESF